MQIKRFPVATTSIITLNAVIFVIGILSGSQIQIIQNYGFIPNDLFYVGSNANDNGNNNNNPAESAHQNPLSSSLPLQSSEPSRSSSSSLPESLIRLFTSMFIHANIAHIAFNLFALAYLGGYAERAIGVPRYVLVYLISGIVGSFISWDYSILHLTQWRCSIDRCFRSYLWCIRHRQFNWQLQGPIIGS